MKNTVSIAICLFVFQLNSAQDIISVPELNAQQKQEVLYSHVIAYAVSGISYAKTKESSPEEYGRYIGKMFIPFWDPAGGFPVFANRIMYILAGMHPDNEMKIEEQGANSIRFRMKNVDSSFQDGPMLGITYEEFLGFSLGIIDEIADFMHVDFSHKVVDKLWYEMTLVGR